MSEIFPIFQEFKKKYADIILLIYFVDDCNYSCSYCYNKKPYSKKNIDIERLLKFIDLLCENNNKKIAIELIGGEPTLHPNLFYFLEQVKKKSIVDICIFTNFSRPIIFYEKIILDYNVRFLATWHSLPFDKNNQIFINKVLKIDKEIFNKTSNIGLKSLFIRIMAERDTFDYSCAIYERLLSIYPENVDISLVADPRQNFKENDFDSNQMYTTLQKNKYIELYRKCNSVKNKQYLTIFNDNSMQYLSFGDMFLRKKYSFYLWKCYAGNEYFYIHSDGNIFPCQSYYEINEKPLFNISQDISKFKKQKYNICKSMICSCDFGIKKEKIFKHIKDF